MKLKLLTGILAISAMVLFYSSCKKSGSNPSGSTLDSKTVTQQLALNLSETLYGSLGGFNLSDGLHQQIYAVTPNHKKIIINTINPDCGLKLDTTITYDLTVDTTKVSVSGRFKFATICTNNNVSGLTIFDSLLVSAVTPSFSAKYNIGQNLSLNALSPQNPESQLSMSGSMNQATELFYKTGSKAKANTMFKYVLSALLIDPTTDALIKSGSATFHTTGDTPQGKWDYSGTIIFLGNNKVTVNIDGKTYTIDISTGQII